MGASVARYRINHTGTCRSTLQYANLLQKWNMFSPDPPTGDGWMHISAVLADGTQIDLTIGKAPSEQAALPAPVVQPVDEGHRGGWAVAANVAES